MLLRFPTLRDSRYLPINNSSYPYTGYLFIVTLTPTIFILFCEARTRGKGEFLMTLIIDDDDSFDLGQQTDWERSGQEIQMALRRIEMLKKLSDESTADNAIGVKNKVAEPKKGKNIDII
jgi:hypothetical protein